MSLSNVLSFINRPWRTPLGKLVSFGIVAFVLYGIYTQVMEKVSAIDANGGEVLYDGSVEEAEAQRLANYLVATEYFSGKPASVRLTKEDGVFHVQFVIMEKFRDDLTLDAAFSYLALGISEEVFGDAETVAHVCDEELNNLREIRRVELGERLNMTKVKLYYTFGVSEAQAQAVGREFEQLAAGNPEGPSLSIQVAKVQDKFEVRFVADADKVVGDADMRAEAVQIARTLSAQIFGGEPVEFHFTNLYFESFLGVSSTEPELPAEEDAVPAQ